MVARPRSFSAVDVPAEFRTTLLHSDGAAEWRPVARRLDEYLVATPPHALSGQEFRLKYPEFGFLSKPLIWMEADNGSDTSPTYLSFCFFFLQSIVSGLSGLINLELVSHELWAIEIFHVWPKNGFAGSLFEIRPEAFD